MIKWNTLRKQKEEKEFQRDRQMRVYYKIRAINIEQTNWYEKAKRLDKDLSSGMITMDEFYANLEGSTEFMIEQLNSINKIDDVETLKKWI